MNASGRAGWIGVGGSGQVDERTLTHPSRDAETTRRSTASMARPVIALEWPRAGVRDEGGRTGWGGREGGELEDGSGCAHTRARPELPWRPLLPFPLSFRNQNAP